MKYFDMKLEQKWAAQYRNQKEQIQEVPQPKLLCIEYKDEQLKEEFKRFIDNKHLKDVDATLEDVDATLNGVGATNATEFGNTDPYLDMELGLNRGEEEGIQYARVNGGAVYEDGKPIGIPSNNPILDSRK